MQISFTYVLATLLLIVASVAFRRYNETQEQQKHDEVVRRHLVNGNTLAQTKKPFLWIHTVFEPNARYWVEFGSRTTTHMNQPYKFMAIKSVIDHCADEFNICLLNDESFAKVIPGWQIDMSNVADPVKSKIRKMGLIKILRQYGGLLVPDSFICSKSLMPLVSDDGGKTLRDEIVASPSLFLGAPPQHEAIRSYAVQLEKTISNDYTAESIFRGDEHAPPKTIADALLGIVDTSGKTVTLDRLMGSTFVKIDPSAYGVYIPDEQLLRSTKYQWFARLSVEQLLKSDTFAGKRFLSANTTVELPIASSPSYNTSA